MFAAGQKEMQLMDQFTIEKLGLPGVVLMENAGAKVVEEILSCAPCKNPRILVLAGGGNNGGDGFVVARRLFDLGIETILCLLANPGRIKGDAKIHFEVYMNRGLPFFQLDENNIPSLRDKLNQADVIVDAILGTGVNGPVRAPFDQVISLVNEYEGKKLVLSVDVPSGISSENGKAAGVAVKASKTITFVFPKRGFFLNEGPQYVGEWKAVDISVPPSIAANLKLDMPKVITEGIVKESLPVRPKNGHKGTFGHTLVIGGSRHFVGAPIFSAKAALHSGSGLVTLAVPEGLYQLAAVQNPESLFLPLPDNNGHFAERAIGELSYHLHQYDCIAVGPGMGRFQNGEKWMRLLIESLENQPIVVDADALYLLRNDLDAVRAYNAPVIFTPHPGEMAGLLNRTVKEVEANRIETARDFAKKYGIYLLLKGHRTIIADPNGDIYINPYGHDALGKGGSGDVLTGLIASFVSQGAAPIRALVAASYLHAKAGEEKAKTLSHYGVVPFDLIDGVKELLNQL